MTRIGINAVQTPLLILRKKIAINIPHNLVQHDKSKHIEINRHFIMEKLRDDQLYKPFIQLEDQLPDALTKVLVIRLSVLAYAK